MKITLSSLFLLLKLMELTDGTCQLIADVTTKEGGINHQSVHQTQLQIVCDTGNCLWGNFTTCGTYPDLGIPEVYSEPEEQCTRQFNLCENSCTNDNTDVPLCQNPTNPSARNEVVYVTHTIVNPCPTHTSTIVNPCPTLTYTPVKVCPLTTSPCISNTTVRTTTRWKQHEICTTIMSTTIMTHIDTSTVLVTTTVTPTPSVPTLTKPSPSTVSIATSSCKCGEPKKSQTTTNPQRITCSSSASSALGALVGILLILMVLVSTALVWTCWTLKKRGGMKGSSMDNNFPNTPGMVNTNYDTDILKRLQNPLYEERPVGEQLERGVELQTGNGEEGDETGPTYEIIPLPSTVNKKASKENGKVGKQRHDKLTAAGSSAPVGGTSSIKPYNSTYSCVGFEDEDNTNNRQKTAIKSGKEQSDETRGGTNVEDEYKLLSNAYEKKDESLRENVYKIQEREDDDKDYEDLEEERENVYHVLEGPTPVREEEEMEEIENADTNAYEIPVALCRKK